MFWRIVCLFVLILGICHTISEFVPLSPGDPFSPSADRDSPLSKVSTPHFDGLICDGIVNSSRCDGCDIMKCIEGSTKVHYDVCDYGTYCGCPYEAYTGCDPAVCLEGHCSALDLREPKINTEWTHNHTHMFRWHLRSRLPYYSVPENLSLLIYMDDGNGGPFHIVSNDSFISNWAEWTVPHHLKPGHYRVSIQGRNDKDIYDMHYPVVIKEAVIVPPSSSGSITISLTTIIYVIASIAALVFIIAVPYSYLSRKLALDWESSDAGSAGKMTFRKVSDWSGSHRTLCSSNVSTEFADSLTESLTEPVESRDGFEEVQDNKTDKTQTAIRHSDVQKYLNLPSRMSVDSFEPHAGKDYTKFITELRRKLSSDSDDKSEDGGFVKL